MISIRCTVLLNHEEIKRDWQRAKLKPFINKHKRKGIDFFIGN